MKSQCVIIQTKDTEQYFHLVLFIMLYSKVVLTFKSVNETLMCDHSNESHWAVLSCSGTVYDAVQRGSKFYMFQLYINNKFNADLTKFSQ